MKLFFRCRIKGCNSLFKKSCNLRDHFRKHTREKPFQCARCSRTFSQSGNLGRHLRNVHKVTRDRIADVKKQPRNANELESTKMHSADKEVEVADSDLESVLALEEFEFMKLFPEAADNFCNDESV